MGRYVIDTNVPIVANGADKSIQIACRIAAVEFLLKANREGMIFVDAAGHIQAEYRTYLNPRGQPGVGDQFYRVIINSDPEKVTRVPLAKRHDGEYEDVPQELIDAGFDPSDRKFVAVAVVAKASVYNATDSDWYEHKAILRNHKIGIVFVCGDDLGR